MPPSYKQLPLPPLESMRFCRPLQQYDGACPRNDQPVPLKTSIKAQNNAPPVLCNDNHLHVAENRSGHQVVSASAQKFADQFAAKIRVSNGLTTNDLAIALNSDQEGWLNSCLTGTSQDHADKISRQPRRCGEPKKSARLTGLVLKELIKKKIIKSGINVLQYKDPMVNNSGHNYREGTMLK
ncbi:unnamed protein product [Soboliphyme baturini]|uniref:Uncharacterized protein n=1 Tax=Soboliphyme baturini TaxID=241478 RepID=A0A183J5M1_9BILA|nr:unnamed protein product [Soboliphyme baturini]